MLWTAYGSLLTADTHKKGNRSKREVREKRERREKGNKIRQEREGAQMSAGSRQLYIASVFHIALHTLVTDPF